MSAAAKMDDAVAMLLRVHVAPWYSRFKESRFSHPTGSYM